jgi:CheY-like chemotaxis protein
MSGYEMCEKLREQVTALRCLDEQGRRRMQADALSNNQLGRQKGQMQLSLSRSPCRTLKRLCLVQYPCNTLPVIMVSAKNQEDDIVKGLQAGCNDYISKVSCSDALRWCLSSLFVLLHRCPPALNSS